MLTGVVVLGLKEEIVISPQQIFALISSGEAHRHVGTTNYNAVRSCAACSGCLLSVLWLDKLRLQLLVCMKNFERRSALGHTPSSEWS